MHLTSNNQHHYPLAIVHLVNLLNLVKSATRQQRKQCTTKYLREQVTGYDTAGAFSITSEYVKLPSQTVQGSFIELPVMRDAVKIVVSLNSSSGYYALSELEVFVGGKAVYDRY